MNRVAKFSAVATCGLVALAALAVVHAADATAAAGDADALLKQINDTRPPALDMSKRDDPAYVRTYILARQEAMKKRAELSKQFADKYPDRPEAPDMLLFAAQMGREDPKEQLALYRRIAEKYPSSDAAKEAAGHVRQADAVGKPFDLSFTDAVSGKKVDLKDMKGKVVVVDFWATWCGPCVHEMPENKQVYEKFHPQGVEFVGVSLDEPESDGGLKALKDFVATNQIPWPQYYQGKGWNSDFSKSWGVDSIPTVFVVDADGKLYSTDARGQLDTILPQLLAKRKPA